MQRREVIYSGDVQGVGFRFTATRVAARFAVTGFVRNLPDGNVQLVAEGKAEELDAFLQSLAEAMSGYIGDTRTETRDASGEFDGFDVRY